MKYGKVITLVKDIFDELDDVFGEEFNDNDIWDNGEGDGIDYSDLGGYDYVDGEEETDADHTYSMIDDDDLDEDTKARWAAIDKLQGKVKKGKCIFCGKRDGMRLNKIGTYACKYCHKDVHHEVYLQWYAGFDVYFEE